VDFSPVAVRQAARRAALFGVYRVALDLGDPGDDAVLADLQDEARLRLPMADLMQHVAVTATAPGRPHDRDLRLAN
jgi:hypothetical protein